MSSRPLALSVATALVVTLAGACSRESPPPPTSPEQALVDVGRPDSAEFEFGSFDFSRPIEGVPAADEGRLASMSWDVYYVLDDGDVGAWGAGMDVFDSPAEARESAEELAVFWVCAGPRSAVDSLEAGSYDVFETTVCRRPSEEGYYATLSASDGRVTANLTLAARRPEVAEAALAGVWASLSDSTQHVVSAQAEDMPSASRASAPPVDGHSPLR